MTTSQKTTTEETTVGPLSCPHCNAALPSQATFCGSCGERVKMEKAVLPLEEQDIQTRYRIKTLVRRYAYTNLYFALDNSVSQENGQTRMVAIRDVDIAALEKEARDQAIALAQHEYACLRRWKLPHTLACIDLRVFQGHLFLVSALPGSTQEPTAGETEQHLYTLQDFLQSGLGLPGEARALTWIHDLGQAVERLHRQHIVLGDLDPYTVVLNKNSAQADPRLMVFWLWPELQQLLPQPLSSSTPQVSYFKAPEALAGEAGVRSDIYSLGALLYLLLTGTPPDESTLRHRRRLRTPRELNTRVSQAVDDCVMRALAVEPEERFTNMTVFLNTLEDVRTNPFPRKSPTPSPEIASGDVETVRIVPLSQKDVARWRAAREERSNSKESVEKTEKISKNLSAQATPPTPPTSTPSVSVESAQRDTSAPDGQLDALPTTPIPNNKVHPIPARPMARLPQPTRKKNPITPPPLPDEPKRSWPQRITNILPTIKPDLPKLEPPKRKRATRPPVQRKGELSLLKQIQHLILGQHQHAIEAAAIVETPLRIRPDQPYNLRLHIMGRDEPVRQKAGKQDAPLAGLSALVHGEIALVEVRSALQQGYTYILQQATVTIPASGYAAEVTIPMQQQTLAPTGRRDRLHVFFLDEQHNPLYEKPFVIEIFVSPLVQFGREGHQVLTIPI